jgi:hypothetical protein
MLIYTTTPTSKPKRKTQKEIEAYNQWLQSVNPSGKKPSRPVGNLSLNKPYRRGFEENKRIPSVDAGVSGALAVKSIMDPLALSRMSEEDREKVVAKSKRVSIVYNKGGYQYLTDETDPTTLGSSERRK